MSRPLVYLAGPIAGAHYHDATAWRDHAMLALRERSIEALSPMRGKQALQFKQISRDFRDYQDHGPAFTAMGIMTRDFSDVKRCDALLVNLLAGDKSFGTAMELAWAYAFHKPVVAAVLKEGPYMRHPMLAQAIRFACSDMDEAIDVVATVLGR